MSDGCVSGKDVEAASGSIPTTSRISMESSPPRASSSGVIAGGTSLGSSVSDRRFTIEEEAARKYRSGARGGQYSAEEFGDVVHQGNGPGVLHARGTEDSKQTGRLVPDLVGGGHEGEMREGRIGVLRSDDHAEPL